MILVDKDSVLTKRLEPISNNRYMKRQTILKREKQMLHLDLAVDNLEKYVELAINLGAKIYKEQFFDSIKIMIDPAGHTFCLCQQ